MKFEVGFRSDLSDPSLNRIVLSTRRERQRNGYKKQDKTELS